MKFKELLEKVESKKDSKEIILGDIYTSIYGYIIPIAISINNKVFICLSLDDEYRYTSHDADIIRENYTFGNIFLFVEKKDIKEI